MVLHFTFLVWMNIDNCILLEKNWTFWMVEAKNDLTPRDWVLFKIKRIKVTPPEVWYWNKNAVKN